MLAGIEAGMHAPTSTNKVRQTQTLLQYLMFLCDSCLLKAYASAVNLQTFCNSLFCLVVIWEQTQTHTHARTYAHTAS